MYTLTRSIINCMLADIVRTSVYLSNHTIFIRPVGRFNFLSRAAFWPPVFRRVSGSIFISEWRYQFSLIRLSIRSYLLGLRSTKLNILSIRRHRMASVSWTSAFLSLSTHPCSIGIERLTVLVHVAWYIAFSSLYPVGKMAAQIQFFNNGCILSIPHSSLCTCMLLFGC